MAESVQISPMGATLKPIRLGRLTLETNLLLAPLAGYTDASFRIVAREFGGVGLGCTDLLSPQGILHQHSGTKLLLVTAEQDRPLAYQLFGSDAQAMCDAARWLVGRGAAVIDINMGCPVDKITQQAGGSSMLRDVAGTVKVVEKIIAAVPQTPVTAKLRLGWDHSSIVAPELARRLEDVGVQLITVHGRTRDMGFGGVVDHDGIAAVVASVKSIPVIGNGDIRSPHDAVEMIRRTGCQGVMIGRAALSAPWIFRDTWQYLQDGTPPQEPTLQEKVQVIRRHFELMKELFDERVAALAFRQRITWYAKRMKPCRCLRDGMRAIRTEAEFEQVLEGFVAWRRNYDEGRGDEAAA